MALGAVGSCCALVFISMVVYGGGEWHMMENILFLARRLFLCGMLSALGMTLVKGSSQETPCACAAPA